MFRLLALAVLLVVLGYPSSAAAQELTPADAPHHGANAYVACELRGQVAVIEGGNSPKHALSADDIRWLKAFCVREALYGGRGADFWTLPVTDDDMKAARFWVQAAGR